MWAVHIHPLVFQEDFPKIGRPARQQILKAVHKKLSAAPEEYGKALSGEFQGYWRLRVGDYRVIYRIHKGRIEVLVVKVGIRRDDEVYRELSFRLGKSHKT